MATTEVVSEEYATLSIRIPPVPSYPKAVVHQIRVRRNAPKIPTPDDSRSLFLKNVPADSTEPHFRAIFTSLIGAGRFESIAFDEQTTAAPTVDPAQAEKVAGFARKRKRTDLEAEDSKQAESAQLPKTWTRRLHITGGTAVALLIDEKSVQLVLKAIFKLQKSKKYPVWGEGLADDVPSLGVPWIAAHLQLCRCDKVDTQRAVHAFFNEFNRKEKEAAELAKMLRNEPDEDGFITVTRGGRAAPANRNEAENAKQRCLERETKRKSETKGFYRFQLRERRKEEQLALLKRFEADKRTVAAMREKRGKFKPEASTVNVLTTTWATLGREIERETSVDEPSDRNRRSFGSRFVDYARNEGGRVVGKQAFFLCQGRCRMFHSPLRTTSYGGWQMVRCRIRRLQVARATLSA
ncbi:hypothetical protein XA68_14435 [Ophiocordyceps unilateralis]|uniref:Ribosomal RNA-processing protein 7 C-terminal domain-containing protein n=1 Tax=Ophiocordyceps unilateralis TaxID=268505 RepID=A0A2A9P905_OPHUN|nr:hypothetical protein XA68_14435 [Ophiocordyceps unilateralis]